MSHELRGEVIKRYSALEMQRSPYIGMWQDLSDYIMGGRGRFLQDDQLKVRRNENLYNEIAKIAANTLASGMQSGITSPARPWFELTTPDPELAEYGSVKTWLDQVQKRLLLVFARSNFYTAMHSMYLEMGTFGQMPVGIYEDFENVIRCVPYTVGSYCLATNGKREVDTLYREYKMTVRQMVDRFGKDNVSRSVRQCYEKKQYDEFVPVIHACEPNIGRDPASPLSKEMPWRSVYIEKNGDAEKILLQTGFEERPFICPRWEIAGEDVYATAYPGLNSIGTNKSLQIEEIDKQIAIEKMHNPPLIADAILENSGVTTSPGDISYIAGMASQGKPGMASVYEVNPRIAELTQDIKEKEARIQRHFYADLFMMITEMDRAQITATEIAERKEEKLLMLGSVLERLNNEALDPIIDRVFAIANRAGILPPPPPEIEGVDLRVEYISVLAQAQKAVATASIESTASFTMQLSNVFPEARHKFDAMQAIDEYAKAKGAPPKVIRTDAEAQELLSAESQQAAAANQAAMAAEAANTAATLSKAEISEDNALGALAGAGPQ